MLSAYNLLSKIDVRWEGGLLPGFLPALDICGNWLWLNMSHIWGNIEYF